MKDIVELEIGVGLGDSNLISYTYSVIDAKLTLAINTWMEKTLEISFFDTLLFFDLGYISIEYFCENMDKKNKLYLEAIDKFEIPSSESDSYKLFQFTDVIYKPSMQIVAAGFHCKILDDMTK